MIVNACYDPAHMADLVITFLGTGTSQGVPVIGCDCRICTSRDPRDQRTRASIYVESPECAFLVDTGPDFRAQALRERIRRVDAVVYTHSHTDHVMGFDDLRPFCFGGRDLPIYAAAETMRDLERVFVFAFNGENRWPGYVRPLPHVVVGDFTLGGTTLTPLPVQHGRARVNGYLLTRQGVALFAYLSDCKTVPESVIERIAGVRHLVVDALRHKPHPTHMSVSEALELAQKVAPERTWLTHLCHELMHAELEPALPETARVAYDGLRIEL
jgi:phosphoribosyl 1,2-cyclic phosphate phosphodiesterase